MRLLLLHLATLLALLAFVPFVRAGTNADTKYTERGQADFDTYLQLLNPYGTWSKVGDLWTYTPTDHQAPYTNGRWVYTEYGWYWKGNLPHSWATEHYGYWKRSDNKIWSWYPGPFWLPETIEIRQTPEYIGWRSAEVDDSGSFVESPIDRYTKFGEWNFVTLAQFANPITPSILAKPDIARLQLEASTDCRHSYLTYREIDRPGPHPADEAKFCKEGGMLPPPSMKDQAQASAPKPRPTVQGSHANSSDTNDADVTQPALLGDTSNPVDPPADTRKVKYWVTMSLPTFWSKPPADALPDQLYLYRPDTFQNQDGIERRITLWFNPNARTALKDILNASPGTKPVVTTNTPDSGPAAPAVPAETESAPGSNPFSSPLDQSFRPGKLNNDTNGSASAPSTNAPAKSPAPSGLQ